MFINTQLRTLQALFFGQAHYFARMHKCSIINIIKHIAFRMRYTLQSFLLHISRYATIRVDSGMVSYIPNPISQLSFSAEDFQTFFIFGTQFLLCVYYNHRANTNNTRRLAERRAAGAGNSVVCVQLCFITAGRRRC